MKATIGGYASQASFYPSPLHCIAVTVIVGPVSMCRIHQANAGQQQTSWCPDLGGLVSLTRCVADLQQPVTEWKALDPMHAWGIAV